MMDCLINAIGSTMSYEGFGFWMTYNWVNFQKLLIIHFKNEMKKVMYKALKGLSGIDLYTIAYYSYDTSLKLF
jgi:hypothetical protein